MSLSEDYRKLLEIWRSNYGREHGWYVEYDGVCVAELVDCEFFEMFWDGVLHRPCRERSTRGRGRSEGP